MNWNEMEEKRQRLLSEKAEELMRDGKIISDRERANPYTCIRITELEWHGHGLRIIWVDGMTCRIEKM